jgi:GrpB-like predicted nucleotidyltransferase (UPF0157 family)
MTEVYLMDYQANWPAQYAQVAAELGSVIAGPGVVVEHVGSTAVPGLCAKPVLDIALGVVEFALVEARIPALAGRGFTYRPGYESDMPDRRYFVRPEGPLPRVHLHAVLLDGALWRQHLWFRDALRQDPELAQSYAALKRHLARVHGFDKAAYTEAKAPFIRQVLAAWR